MTSPLSGNPPTPTASSLPATVAIVPAAGFGTRLRPLSDAIPKEMLPVGGRLALERIVAELHGAGIERVVFVLSPAKEPFVRGYFGESRDGVAFEYVLQPEMRGLGDAVLRAEGTVPPGAPFVVALGDAVFEEPTPGALTGRLVRSFVVAGASVGLAVQRVPRERISRYGVVRPATEAEPGMVSAAGQDYLAISDIVEKPIPEEAPSDLAAAARYVLTGEVFDVLRDTPPGKGGEIQLTDALRNLLRRDGGVGIAVPLAAGEVRHDIGGLDSYYRAFLSFALADPQHGAGLHEYLMKLIKAGAGPAEADVE